MRSRSYITLDGLRGIAALAVVVLHWHRLIGDMTWSSAALAVDLFFSLSGFVLAHAYEDRLQSQMTPGQFMKARLIRLYPLYLVGILLGVVEALATIRWAQASVAWNWQTFWTALPLNLVMLPTPWKLFPFNGVMWSIFLELLVNAIWVCCFPLLRSTRNLAIVVIVSALGLAGSFAIYGTFTGLGLQWGNMPGGVFRVCFSFFLGVLLYRLRSHAPKLPAIVLLIGLPAVLFQRLTPAMELMAVLFVLPWFVWLGSAAEPSGVLAKLCHWVGAASYAVYAIHARLYRLVYGAALKLGIDLQLFAPWVGIGAIVILVAVCLALNRYYDEPVRKWLARRLGQAKAVDREPVTQAP